MQGIGADKDDPPVLAEAQSKFAEVSRTLLKDGGLMALRTDALANKEGADAAYQTLRGSLLQGFAGIDGKMAEAVDQKEIQLLKNRQRMEAAFKQQSAALQLMTNASGINVDSKELNSGVRRIMLALEPAEVSKLGSEMSSLRERIQRQTELARGAASSPELQRGLATVLQNLKTVSAAIDKIVQTKAQMLTSDKAMQNVFVSIRAITQEQAQRGEQQVSAVKIGQEKILTQLASRANLMLTVLLIVGAVIAALVLIMSARIVRSITQQLGDLVNMATSVASTGNFSLRLKSVENDEIGQTVQAFNRLMDSLQQAIDETNQVMTAVSAGQFDVRMRADMHGDLGRLKVAVNQTATAMEAAIDAVTHSMQAMAKGDFTQTVAIELGGELGELKHAVNDSMGSIRTALSEVSSVMAALAAGRFDARVHAEMPGDLAAMKQAVNGSATAMQSAIEAVARSMRAMAAGDFSHRVDTPLQGDLATLKQAVNESLDQVRSAIGEVNRLMGALADGDLDQRIDIDMSGELAQLKDNVNRNTDSIRTALGEVGTLLGAMAAGDLTRRTRGNFPGAFGQLASHANDAIGQLATTVRGIKNTAEIIHSGTRNIAEGNLELASRSEQQAASLEETAASMEQLAQTVRQNNDSAQEANHLAHQAADVAEHGGDVVRQVVQTMGEVRDSSQEIVSITEIINSIAFQTNILSLNAAVEAARVGEHGKGFAVVAIEVRSLAQRCAKAAEDIKRLIDESVQRISNGNQLAIEAGERMTGIVASIKQVSIAVTDISNASSEQIQGIELVNRALTQLDEFTQRNVALVSKASDASRSMQQEAEDLAQSVSLFQIAPQTKGTGNAIRRIA